MTASRLPYLLTATLLVTAVVVVFVAVGASDSECDADVCGPPQLDLPSSNLRYGYTGDGKPATTVALFLDLNSHASRRLFTSVTQALHRGELGPAELVLFHAPMGDCIDSSSARSCDAARAVECAEELRPGAGVKLAGRALDLLWQPADTLDHASLLDVAEELGLDRAPLSACTDRAQRPDIAELILKQSIWARTRGLAQGTPGGFLVRRDDGVERSAPFGEWLTQVELHPLWRCTGETTATTCDRRAPAP